MADYDNPIDTGYEPPPKQKPWGIIAAVAAFVLIGVLAFWLTREKKNDKARQEVLNALDKDLGDEEAAIKAEREKVLDLTRQVETLRTAIQLGQVQSRKQAVAEFNALAAQQRAERVKFTTMAEAYNKKVAEYRALEQ